MIPFTRELISQVLEQLDEGVHIVDASGITVYYNSKAAQLDGLNQEEVLGIPLLEAFPSLTKKTSTLLQVLESGKAFPEQQQTFTNRNGKQITTINRTFPLVHQGKVVGAIEISRDITSMKRLSDQVIDLQERIWQGMQKKQKRQRLYQFSDIVTQDERMIQEIERAKRAALTTAPVLVVGETGTGKELFVQSIHSYSPRKNKPFIVQNCASIPSTLLESILFGTAKGAFTGAEDRPGLFELADGGSLFLDEIHAMPLDLQAKLLRVLEEGLIRRVGETKIREVDVRILVATNEDPWQCVQEGKLRKDLYYRVQVVRIEIPPLRERKGDIQILTNYFLGNIREIFGFAQASVSQEVIDAFLQYDWPGNVRELKNTIEGAMHLAWDEEIRLEHLPSYFSTRKKEKVDQSFRLPEAVERYEQELILQMMEECGGKVSLAAEKLGIPRQTLQYKLKKIGWKKG